VYYVRHFEFNFESNFESLLFNTILWHKFARQGRELGMRLHRKRKAFEEGRHDYQEDLATKWPLSNLSGFFTGFLLEF
jgi:hypothetical protein